MRWRKRGRTLLWIALSGILALLLAWRGAIWYSERAPAFDGTPLPACGPGSLQPAFQAAVDESRAEVQALMAERRIPGLTIAAVANGELIWSEGFGWADRETRRPACPEGVFRIASLSKPLTAALLARLYEQGRLRLDDSVYAYVPDFPPKGHDITLRQLAGHRAGIRSYRDDNEALTFAEYKSARDSLEVFAQDPLVFAPGTGSLYSGYGYVLLSAALEGAGGADFPALMTREVLHPLGMTRTRAERKGDEPAGLAAFYDPVTPYSQDGSIVTSPPLNFSSKWAAGGFLSTTEDMARFGSAHIPRLNRGFLKVETIDQMHTPATGMLGFGYGLGWMLARDLRLRRVRFHFGAGSGATSVLAVYPDEGVSIAILCNLGHARLPMNRLLRIVNPILEAAD